MLKLILGPMFSGKTSFMLQQLEEFQRAGKNVELWRPGTDTRRKFTHDDQKTDIPTFTIEKLPLFPKEETDVVGVDEVQFFSPSDIKYLNNIATFYDVIVNGLSATSESEPWETVQALIPLADDIMFLKSRCSSCGGENASRSFFREKKDRKVAVGDKNQYEALCRKCYNQKMEDKM